MLSEHASMRFIFFLCTMAEPYNLLHFRAESAFAFNIACFKAWLKKAKLFIYFLHTLFIGSTKHRTYFGFRNNTKW